MKRYLHIPLLLSLVFCYNTSYGQVNEEEIETICQKTLSILSGPEGEARDWKAFEKLFTKDATLQRLDTISGKSSPLIPLAFFLEKAPVMYETNGFYERALKTTTHIQGDSIAYVQQIYHSISIADSTETHEIGVNNYTLVRTNKAWKIRTLKWHEDINGTYLSNPEQYLDFLNYDTLDLDLLKFTGSATFHTPMFDLSKATFLWDSTSTWYPTLSILLEYLKKNKDVRLEIQYHTDCRGTQSLQGRALTQRRAQAIVQWLISKGINAERLIAAGYGEEAPYLTPNVSGIESSLLTCAFVAQQSSKEYQEALLQLNRRLVIKIISD